MHRHVADKCLALNHEERAVLAAAFHSIDGDAMEIARKRSEKMRKWVLEHPEERLAQNSRRTHQLKLAESRSASGSRTLSSTSNDDSSERDDSSSTDTEDPEEFSNVPLKDELATQFVTDGQGVRRQFGSLRRVLGELRVGKLPAKVLGVASSGYETTIEAYFPQVALKLDRHHSDLCR